MTAALTALTVRSLLVPILPAAEGASPALARVPTTVRRLSHGRLRIIVDALPLPKNSSGLVGGLCRRSMFFARPILGGPRYR
jgi:hypothetical protein